METDIHSRQVNDNVCLHTNTKFRPVEFMSQIPDQVIGALLALLGVLVAQLIAIVQTRLEQNNKRNVLLREKYEELGMHFLDSMKLPHTLMTCANMEQALSLTHQESANSAHLLALLYFPRLTEATGSYIESYASLFVTIASIYDESDARSVGMQVVDNPEYMEASNNHIASRDYLQDQIQDFATTYAKS